MKFDFLFGLLYPYIRIKFHKILQHNIQKSGCSIFSLFQTGNNLSRCARVDSQHSPLPISHLNLLQWKFSNKIFHLKDFFRYFWWRQRSSLNAVKLIIPINCRLRNFETVIAVIVWIKWGHKWGPLIGWEDQALYYDWLPLCHESVYVSCTWRYLNFFIHF